MPHPSEYDVDKFMDHIKKAMSVRLEAERLSQGYLHSRTALQAQMEGARLRKESQIAFVQAEYMAYELIDAAVERSENQWGNIPHATERVDEYDVSGGKETVEGQASDQSRAAARAAAE